LHATVAENASETVSQTTTTEPNTNEATTGFADLGLSQPVLAALDAVGYETPSQIQAETIPHVLAGRDVIGQAQTGTGKTAAFATPLLSRIDLDRREPSVLVLTPTRELAIQVADSFTRYADKIKGFRVLSIYGGSAYDRQLDALRRGVHVVVGTPGRVMDHLRRGTLKVDNLETLVLDEADEMLRMGFIEDVEWILEQTPPERQLVLFSATMPGPIRRIARTNAKDPVEITVKGRGAGAETIRQRYWVGHGSAKLDALVRILEVEPFDGMIIFVRTKTATVELCERLNTRGFKAAALNGDIAQNLRERTVERLERGHIDILIATDVAARGLDVERISHVVNFDIPYDAEAYVHRIGRTGRAGRDGEAILFVAPREQRLLRTIERHTKQKITAMPLPSNKVINEKRIARFEQRITETIERGRDIEFFTELIEKYVEKTEDASPIEVAAALAKLVQGETSLLVKEPPPRHRSLDDGPPRDRGMRDRRPRKTGPPQRGMARFRIEVGHMHGVRPGNIVGAIANEAGLDGKHIHGINIFDEHATVDLPADMPLHIMNVLKKTRVVGRKLNISHLEGGSGVPGRPKKGGPRSLKKAGKRKG